MEEIDVWTIRDFDNGQCQAEDIGQPVFPHLLVQQENASDTLTVAPAEPFVMLSKADRRRLTQELSDKLLILAHEDPQRFMEDAGPQINKFLDMASKLDDENKEKALKDMEYFEMRTYLQEQFLNQCISCSSDNKESFLALMQSFSQDEAMKVALSSESYQ